MRQYLGEVLYRTIYEASLQMVYLKLQKKEIQLKRKCVEQDILRIIRFQLLLWFALQKRSYKMLGEELTLR